MQVLVNSEVEKNLWLELFTSSDQASPFQHPVFYETINSVSGYSAEVFAVVENNLLLSLVLVVIQKEPGLKAYFSSRGIIYGGPLIRGDNKTALEFLLKSTEERLKGKVIYLESRNFFDYTQFNSVFKKANWSYIPYLNIKIDIANKSMPDLLYTMSYNRRREINLSFRENVAYSECSSQNEFKKLYSILSDLYNRKVKLPLPGFDFFHRLFSSPIAKVFIVKHKDNIIGGSFCVFFPKTALFTFYYCGLKDYNKKIFPTHIAIYAAMEYAYKTNIPVVDLMGAGKPNNNYGVRNYKSQFGGDLMEQGRFLKILNPFLFNIGKVGLRVLKSLN